MIACGKSGLSRSDFKDAILGRTQEEVIASMAGLKEVDESVADRPYFIYLRKTFDPQNHNAVDEKTLVKFARSQDGKFRVIESTLRECHRSFTFR